MSAPHSFTPQVTGSAQTLSLAAVPHRAVLSSAQPPPAHSQQQRRRARQTTATASHPAPAPAPRIYLTLLVPPTLSESPSPLGCCTARSVAAVPPGTHESINIAMVAVASVSASPVPAARAPPPAAFLPLRAHRLRLRAPVVTATRRIRAEATKTEREKGRLTEVAVEESFPFRETAPPEPAEAPTEEEGWVVKLEQSVNIFLTDSVIMILDGFYRDRDYARFFVLETIARVPYFSFISVLHLYETFGWWRRADYIKVHFAESWNELHHLLIMEELGGNSVWFDRFLARFVAFFYYFMTVAMYMLSPRMAYHFSECVERHAYSTYDKFLKLHGEELKKLPAPEAALNYYLNEDLYLFDEFQTERVPRSRRPKIDNLYDVFVNIRDDEAEHCKTMKACQTHGNLRSPHSMQNYLDTDVESVISEE